MYKALMHPEIPIDINKKIWKTKIPLKTKYFGSHLLYGVILTKYILAKRN
jgi:hypothetical protein